MLTLKNIQWTAPDGGEILNGIDFTIESGKLTVITGPNGSGKTTLAKVIAGVVHQTAGEIWMDGENISDLDITERAKLGVAYGFQQPVRFKGLTVRDMLDLSAKETLKEEAICGLMDQVGLCTKDYIDREVNASLSGGEIKRIEIATVLARRDAKVMVFDEPEAGIDLWSFNGLIDSFERLKKENDKALLVISHQERLLSIADEIIVIQDGKVRIQGPTEEIMPQLMYDERSSSCPIGKDPEWLKEFQLSRAGA